jgi:hypothetical protein
MSEHIEFVSNYNDLSTDRGFHFEFLCNRCGSGIRTRFPGRTIGSVSGALDTASSLFGGILTRLPMWVSASDPPPGKKHMMKPWRTHPGC